MCRSLQHVSCAVHTRLSAKNFESRSTLCIVRLVMPSGLSREQQQPRNSRESLRFLRRNPTFSFSPLTALRERRGLLQGSRETSGFAGKVRKSMGKGKISRVEGKKESLVFFIVRH